MNGIEITKIIRSLSIPKKANLPIIALTGNTQDEDIQNYLNAGMNDFAGKPITYEKISEILTKIDNQFYTNQLTPPNIDFSDDKETTDIEEPEDDLNEISPLAAYTSQISSSQSSPSILLDEEEDSFAVAVQRFEEMEKTNTAPLSAKDNPKDSLSQRAFSIL
jgi:CheY-like chemotaxis protein